MILKILRIIIGLCLTGLTQAQETLQSVELDLHGNGQMTEVDLPFPYLPKKYEKTLQKSKVFIFPGTWTYAVPGAVYLTGSVSPGVALVASYQRKNGKTRVLVANIDYLTDINSLTSPILKLAGKDQIDRQKFSMQIFTVKSDQYTHQFNKNINMTWQDLHKGKTQIDYLRSIKDALSSSLKINRTQIKAQMYTDCSTISQLGNYILAPRQLAILSSGQIYSISHYPSDPLFTKTDNQDIKTAQEFMVADYRKIIKTVHEIMDLRFSVLGLEFSPTQSGKIPMLSLGELLVLGVK